MSSATAFSLDRREFVRLRWVEIPNSRCPGGRGCEMEGNWAADCRGGCLEEPRGEGIIWRLTM
jgi:hypothetical protein